MASITNKFPNKKENFCRENAETMSGITLDVLKA